MRAKAKKNYLLCLSHKNSKMGDMIWSVSQPVILTCDENLPCYKDCYGVNSYHLRQKTYRASTKRNYDVYEREPDYYFQEIAERTSLVRYFRWHVVGDIVDVRYLYGMIRVAERNPGTNYLAFTKRFELVNAVRQIHGEFPPNLSILFSAWDKGFEVENPFGFPVCYVNFKDKAKNPAIPETAWHCPGHCPECMRCWSVPKGGAIEIDEH